MPRYAHTALRNKHVSDAKPITWKAIEAVSSEALQRFFRNVKYLLDSKDISIAKMRRDIYSTYGYRIGINAVRQYETRKYTRCNTDYMGVLCLYLREDFVRMLSIEYATEHKAKQQPKTA